MKLRIGLAFALLLASCHSPEAAVGKKVTPRASQDVQLAASSQPAGTASPVPSAGPTAGTSPKPAVVAKLEAPTAASVALSGVVQVDPGYIVAAKAGAVVGKVLAAGSNAALRSDGALTANGRVVADGPGNVVAVVGGALVGDAGSGLVTANAADVATSDSGNVVAPGAAIIANNGGSVVANNGGSVVSNNGSSLAGKQRHLLQTTSQLVPGAGLLVGALSLRTHKYLGLGKYQGQDVYAIYTNADGAYKLYLPSEDTGNVLVVACPPVQTNDDRLIYNVVAEPKPHEEPIDEDAALAGRYLHFAFSSRMAEVLRQGKPGADHVADLNASQAGLPPSFQAAFKDFLYRLVDEGAKYDVAHWKNPKDVIDLATSFTDVALSYLDPHVRISPATLTNYRGPEEEAVAAVVDAMRQLRQATHAKVEAQPSFFGGQAFLFQDDCDVEIPTKLEVRKSTDPGDYVVSHFMTTNTLNGFFNTGLLYKALGVPGDQDLRLEAAAYAILQNLLPILLTHDEVFAQIKTFCTRPGFKPELDPALQPQPVPTCKPLR